MIEKHEEFVTIEVLRATIFKKQVVLAGQILENVPYYTAIAMEQSNIGEIKGELKRPITLDTDESNKEADEAESEDAETDEVYEGDDPEADYSSMTLPELKESAEEAGIDTKGFGNKKTNYVKALVAWEQEQGAE